MKPHLIKVFVRPALVIDLQGRRTATAKEVSAREEDDRHGVLRRKRFPAVEQYSHEAIHSLFRSTSEILYFELIHSHMAGAERHIDLYLQKGSNTYLLKIEVPVMCEFPHLAAHLNEEEEAGAPRTERELCVLRNETKLHRRSAVHELLHLRLNSTCMSKCKMRDHTQTISVPSLCQTRASSAYKRTDQARRIGIPTSPLL